MNYKIGYFVACRPAFPHGACVAPHTKRYATVICRTCAHIAPATLDPNWREAPHINLALWRCGFIGPRASGWGRNVLIDIVWIILMGPTWCAPTFKSRGRTTHTIFVLFQLKDGSWGCRVCRLCVCLCLGQRVLAARRHVLHHLAECLKPGRRVDGGTVRPGRVHAVKRLGWRLRRPVPK